MASIGNANTVIAPAATSIDALAEDISPASTATPVTATISGSPVVIQWAVTLAITMTSSATGCNASSSRLPSS